MNCPLRGQPLTNLRNPRCEKTVRFFFFLFFLGVFSLLFRFCCLSVRFWRWWACRSRRCVLRARSFFGFVVAQLSWWLLGAACLPGLLLFLFVRSVFFVRFRSPSVASFGGFRAWRRLCVPWLSRRAARRLAVSRVRPSVFGGGFVRPVSGLGLLPRCAGWRVVPAAALPALRASSWVWAVRPAVVRRRRGVVCAFWVFVVPSWVYALDPDETRASETKAQTKQNMLAA